MEATVSSCYAIPNFPERRLPGKLYVLAFLNNSARIRCTFKKLEET